VKNPVKQVAAIHDISGFGRASLTEVIPILSVMGIKVCPFPTAVLSSITGYFENSRLIDLTPRLRDYMAHWKELGLSFDAVYSGFLGSSEQIDIVSDFIDDFRVPEQIVVVDPVMADNGVLYETMDERMVGGMRRLVGKADLVTPNFTEACLLLGEAYRETVGLDEMKAWVRRIADMGPNRVIITSVPELPDAAPGNARTVTNIAYDKADGRFWRTRNIRIPASYPGTGDIFTSVLLGSLLDGDSLPIAVDRAAGFVELAVRATFGFNLPEREGVLLERVLGSLGQPAVSGAYEIV
jgi:pyridoxine kinase